MAEIDPIIHAPARLRIMSALVALQPRAQLDFRTLGKTLDLTDGNLGAHLQTLEEAGYIKIEKSFVDRKPRTVWVDQRPGRIRGTSPRCGKFAGFRSCRIYENKQTHPHFCWRRHGRDCRRNIRIQRGSSRRTRMGGSKEVQRSAPPSIRPNNRRSRKISLQTADGRKRATPGFGLGR